MEACAVLMALGLAACGGDVGGSPSGSGTTDTPGTVGTPGAPGGTPGTPTPTVIPPTTTPGDATDQPGVTPAQSGEQPAVGDAPAEPADEPPPPIVVDITLTALPAHTSVGLEWNVVEGASAYRLYASDAPGLDAGALTPIETTRPAHVDRGLTDGVPRYYAVSAVLPQGESAPSPEVEATPDGEWVLEQLGSGLFDDVLTGAPVARVPVADRIHVLLFAEGYTADDMTELHALPGHDGARDNDVDRWIDDVFSIEPYDLFPDAFVVWYLPRESSQTIGGDTAFAVPADTGSGFAQTLSIPTDGETASRTWQAIAAHPLPPTDFGSGFARSARNHIAYFLMFDPARGRASVSGRATSLTDPATGNRIQAAFGVPFAHELTHSFSRLGDEYLDNARGPSDFWGDTDNVVPTNRCDEVPWRHLLPGSAINPDVAELVGAFGREGLGFHPELLCLLNGTHDNAEFYGGDGLLRSDDRMCNFCREMTAYRVFERSGILAGDASFDTWVTSYRGPFYERFGLSVPALVPQTNDVRDPASGDPIYEACVP